MYSYFHRALRHFCSSNAKKSLDNVEYSKIQLNKLSAVLFDLDDMIEYLSVRIAVRVSQLRNLILVICESRWRLVALFEKSSVLYIL